MISWIEKYREAGQKGDRDGMSGRSSSITSAVNAQILRQMTIDADDRVLDLGCGDGSFLAMLPSSTSRIGISPTEEEVAALVKFHDGSTVRFLKGTATSIPVADGTVTKLVCNGVFLVLSQEEIMPALREMRRVCARTATVYIGEIPAPLSFFYRVAQSLRIVRIAKVLIEEGPRAIMTRASRPIVTRKATGLTHFSCEPGAFRKMCEDAGFKVLRSRRHNVRVDGKRIGRERFNYMLRLS